jgi:hypothetical protein
MVALAVMKVVCSQLAVGLVPCEHVVEGDKHGMADGEHCATFATGSGDTAELSC